MNAQTMLELADRLDRKYAAGEISSNQVAKEALAALRRAALPPSQEVPAPPQADVREAWSCGTCGDRDVPQKFRVFGSCYKCAAQRSINTRNRKIERLRALASEGKRP